MSGICETAVKGLADSQSVHGTERALPACLPACVIHFPLARHEASLMT